MKKSNGKAMGLWLSSEMLKCYGFTPMVFRFFLQGELICREIWEEDITAHVAFKQGD